jgi:hypothetical protein
VGGHVWCITYTLALIMNVNNSISDLICNKKNPVLSSNAAVGI